MKNELREFRPRFTELDQLVEEIIEKEELSEETRKDMKVR